MKTLLTLMVAAIFGCPLFGALTDGLVAHYKFDGNANDSSGNGNNGVVHGATLTTDRSGKTNSAYLFDGYDDWIEVAHSASLSMNAMTVSVWLKPNGWAHTNGDWIPVICKANYSYMEGSYRFEILKDGDGADYQLRGEVYSAEGVGLGQWQQITVTLGSDGLKVYHNGLFIGVDTSTDQIENLSDVLAIGRSLVGSMEYYNGMMDDLRIYNRALSATEVKALYEGDGDPKTWYVNGTSGLDSYSGTSSSQAKKTIQAAIDAASSGDMILVAAGTYAPIDATGKKLTIRSTAGAARTFIDGEKKSRCALLSLESGWFGPPSESSGAFDTVLEGFTLVNGCTSMTRDEEDNGGGGVCGGCVIGCVIRQCFAYGGGGASNAKLHRCMVVENTSNDDAGGCHMCIVYDSLICRNKALNEYGGGAGSAATASMLYNCTLTQNVAYENDCDEVGAIDYYMSAYNCIVWANVTDKGREANISSAWGEYYGDNVNNYVLDPHFVDVANGDYRLAVNSPCIDAGDNSYVTSATDLDGNERIVNGMVDIGCYEYGTESSPDKGLVAWYKFDGDERDSSANGYNLTSCEDCGLPVLTSDRNGNANSAYLFDGSKAQRLGNVDEVQRMNAPRSTFTFALWFQTEASYADYGAGWAWNLGNYAFAPINGDVIESGLAGLGVKVGRDGIEVVEHSGYYMPTVLSYHETIGTAWNHLAVTIENDGKPILYLNGVKVGEGEKTDRVKCVWADAVGGLDWGYYTGKVDDLCIYNRALSVAEVKALYEGDDAPETWYVNGTSGSDDYSGKSSSLAKKTIQAAIDVALSGDVIRVSSGVYAPIGTSNKSLTIVAINGPDETYIDGMGKERCVNTHIGLGLETKCLSTKVVGFTIQNGHTEGYGDDANGCGALGGTYVRCVFSNNRSNSYMAGGGACDARLENCLLVENSTGGNGGACSGSELINCTVVDNYASDNGGGAYMCKAYNCIFFGNTSGWDWGNDGGQLYWTQTESACLNDPCFADAAHGNYQLAPNSPCIDAGDNAYLTSATDLDGNARIVNGKIDIGCYEHGTESSLSNGLVAWYKFDGNANDSSGNGNNGVVHGAILTTDRFGNANSAYSFDGNDWIQASNVDVLRSITKSVTVSAWVKPTGWYENVLGLWLPVVRMGGNDDATWGLQLQYQPVGSSYWVRQSKDGYWIEGCAAGDVYSSRDIKIGAWQLVTLTYDGSTTRCYVDGVESGSLAGNLNWDGSDEDFYIGADLCGGDEYFKGGIDDVRIYNRALSAAEVKALYEGDGAPVATKCAVTFDAAGGTARWTKNEVVKGAAVGTLPTATRAGYEFLGWFTAAVGGTQVTAATVVTSDVTYYAQWAQNVTYYTVTFNANGGSCSMSSKQYASGETLGTLPTATREGYEFLGWFTAAVGGTPVTAATVVTADVTFYAHWTPIEYDISYLYLKGSENPNPATYTIEDELTFTALSDILGWTFVGWSLDGISLGSTGDKTVSARWTPVTYGISYAGVKGGANPNPTSYTIEDAITFTALSDVMGYRFAGWSPRGIEVGTTGNKTITAQYEPIRYAITYVNTMGAANPNPTSYTIEDAVTFAALPDVEGWRFVGWSFAGISRGNTGDVTVSANWEVIAPSVIPDDEEPMDAGVANTYDGIIMDADGLPVGYISIKAGKASGKGAVGTSKVTATIQMVGEAKKVTVKGDVNVSEAMFVQPAPDGRVLDLMFTRNSIFGTFDGYEIEGVRNILASTAKGDKGSAAKQRAEAIYGRLKGNYVMAYGDENGWNGLSVSVAAKGKVKVSGKLADGTSVATSTQLIVGEDYSCIPVIYTKKDVSLAFSIYFSNDGGELSVFGYYDAVISRVTALGGERAFCLDGDPYGIFEEAGYELVEEFLPWEVPVAPKGTKWIVADGAKAGQIKMDKDGEVYDKKESDNPSGLKLTFTAKTGLFKGSFKVYAIDAKGKLKSFSATVNGIVVDGIGYGTVTIKKIGSVPVAIE